MKDVWKWIWAGGGAAVIGTILLFAGRYAIGQEVEPDVLFDRRYEQAQEMKKVCLERYEELYCAELDRWLWKVKYPYQDCIAGLEYDEREPKCGPEPKPPAPPED
ncbi:MAG: hypothetical protein AMJ65_15525 [Phycisphaerae bacterium SG8_4]|nr:MAG: hypothetical protein AMJ65_15525 [Phycisphaerae bacterium SG8_4]